MGKNKNGCKKGYKQSEEHTKKRIESAKRNGKTNWKGLNPDLLKEEYLKGKSTHELAIMFNVSQQSIYYHLKPMGILIKQGQKRLNDEQRKALSDRVKNDWRKEEYRKKVYNAKIGRKSDRKGKTLDEIYDKDIAIKMRENLINNRKNQIFPKKDSSIELKIQGFLSLLHLEYYTHKYMDIEHGYQCDILVPVQKGISKKTIIECFGTYWHNYPYGREIDIKRCTELREKGFRVLVFWENEIKLMNIFDFGIKLRC